MGKCDYMKLLKIVSGDLLEEKNHNYWEELYYYEEPKNKIIGKILFNHIIPDSLLLKPSIR